MLKNKPHDVDSDHDFVLGFCMVQLRTVRNDVKCTYKKNKFVTDSDEENRDVHEFGKRCPAAYGGKGY